MERIQTLEQDSEDNKDELAQQKQNFSLTLSVDYQMNKLVPYWGLTPQPGSNIISKSVVMTS
jgi:hypothetical protein